MVLEELKPDGIVFTGGNDLSSLNDNAESRLRDDFERKLFDVALQQNILVLPFAAAHSLSASTWSLARSSRGAYCHRAPHRIIIG